MKVNAWNIYNNGATDLVVALLKGSNYSEDHCVTLYGQWISDSNLPKALPLSKESLDLCVSSDGERVLFDKVKEAYFCTNYMNWIGNEKKKQKKKEITEQEMNIFTDLMYCIIYLNH